MLSVEEFAYSLSISIDIALCVCVCVYVCVCERERGGERDPLKTVKLTCKQKSFFLSTASVG